MKRLLIPLLLGFVVCLTACSGAQTTDRPSQEKTAAVTEASGGSTADEARKNPYTTDNRYDIDEKMFEKRGDVDYGTVQKDVTYYSKTAGDNKQCNILLPSGYSESQTYPVMYVFHGFGGSHSNQIDTDSYLTLLYGNMLRDGLTKPMIIVNVDMYTDKLADKDSKTDEQLRYIYDKAIDDVALDLMHRVQMARQIRIYRRFCARYRRDPHGILQGHVLEYAGVGKIPSADRGNHTLLPLYGGGQQGPLEHRLHLVLPRRAEQNGRKESDRFGRGLRTRLYVLAAVLLQLPDENISY